MEKASALVRVYGRVQGVGFRFFVREQANRMGIKGWVRNMADGGVEMFAQGDRESLDIFLERVKKGPAFGHVEKFNIDWITSEKKYDEFTIKF
jgi:acylphosphatase